QRMGGRRTGPEPGEVKNPQPRQRQPRGVLWRQRDARGPLDLAERFLWLVDADGGRGFGEAGGVLGERAAGDEVGFGGEGAAVADGGDGDAEALGGGDDLGGGAAGGP